MPQQYQLLDQLDNVFTESAVMSDVMADTLNKDLAERMAFKVWVRANCFGRATAN